MILKKLSVLLAAPLCFGLLLLCCVAGCASAPDGAKNGPKKVEADAAAKSGKLQYVPDEFDN